MGAWSLAEAYFKEYFKRVPRKYKIYDITKHKWWGAFVKADDTHNWHKEYNEEKFIKAQFEKNEMIYPHQLATKKSWDTYMEFLPLFQEENKEVVVAKKVAYYLREIKLFLNKGKTIREYVLLKKERILKNQDDLYVFVFMKEFFDIFEQLDFPQEKIMASKAVVKGNDKILKAIKNVLPEESFLD